MRATLSRPRETTPDPTPSSLGALLSAAKLAHFDQSRATALQVMQSCVRSTHTSDKTASPGTVGSEKLAAAAVALDQLLHVTSALRADHEANRKFAASLVQAVKMAEDGLLDVKDIIDTAVELSGDSKLAATFTSPQPVASAGELDSNPRSTGGADELTAFLRSH